MKKTKDHTTTKLEEKKPANATKKDQSLQGYMSELSKQGVEITKVEIRDKS